MKIQHKRSSALESGKAKQPTAPQTEYGELCVNFNHQDPSLFIKDSSDVIRKIGGDLDLYALKTEAGANVIISPNAPTLDANANPIREGQLWWADSDVDDGGGRLYVWTGDEWVDTSLPGAGSQVYLSKVNDDTAAGEITFEGKTIHDGDIQANKILSDEQTYGPNGDRASTEMYVLENSPAAVVIENNGSVTGSDFGQTLQLNYRGTHDHTKPFYNLVSVVSTEASSTQDVYSMFFGIGQQNTAGNVGALYIDINNGNNAGAGGAYGIYSGGNSPTYFAADFIVADDPKVDPITSTTGSGHVLSPLQAKFSTDSGTATTPVAWFNRIGNNTGWIHRYAFDGVFNACGIQGNGAGKAKLVGITTTTSILKTSLAASAIVDATETVKALSPTQQGFTAQDILDHVPSIVNENDPNSDEILIEENKLIPVLTKALQEVIAKNEELEARLAALEGA